jgi:Rrf2 family protein
VNVTLTQKCLYALRAVLELSKMQGEGPVKAVRIAESQAIPVSFLQLILAQLKQGGFVASVRGREGGYVLARPPKAVTVGDIIRFVDSPFDATGCHCRSGSSLCSLDSTCVFSPLWGKVRAAVAEVLDGTTFRELAELERQRTAPALDYCI